MSYNSFFVVAAFVAALYYGISLAWKRYNQYKFAKEQGCGAPVRLPQFERILGLGFIRQMRSAISANHLLRTNVGRHERYGDTFSVGVMGQTVVITRDPENCKALLSSQFKDFGLGDRMKTMGELLGHGIFTADGAHWEHSRALVRPNFVKTQVADLDLFEEHLQNMFARIPKDGSTVDLQPLLFSLTIDTSSEFLFGTSVHSLLNKDEDSATYRFGKCFDAAQKTISDKTRLIPMTQSEKDFKACCKVCLDFVDSYIRVALEARKSGKVDEKLKDGDERYVFLDELAKATSDPISLRSELMNILVAGRDTTASLLSNTMHVLSNRPDVWAKLQAEIDTLNGEKPTYDTLRNMRYLKFVLNESLRVYPAVPGNARYALKDTTLPLGGGPNGDMPMFVAKGTIICYSVWSMHRRKDVYGPDAEEFRPERWANPDNTRAENPLDNDHKFREGTPLRPGWAYLPFNGGPRICVGQQFALTEAGYVIVRLAQEYKGIQSRDARPWEEKLALTVSSANGVLVGMEKR